MQRNLRVFMMAVVLILATTFAVGCSRGGEEPTPPADETPPPSDVSEKDLDDPISVTVKAAYDDQEIALMFQWETNKDFPGLLQDVRGYVATEQTWVRPASFNEDRVAIQLENPFNPIVGFSTVGCFATCHDKLDGMPGDDGSEQEHSINSELPNQGTMLDLWHWRGGRSGPMGYAEDTWISVNTRERDSSAGFVTNTLRSGGDRLRENLAFAVEWTSEGIIYLLPEYVFAPELNSGFYFLNDGEKLILADEVDRLISAMSIEAMEAGQLQHALIATGPQANALYVPDLSEADKDEIAAQLVEGALITAVVSFGYESDQHDIRSTRSFDNTTKIWTVTLYRALNTGSEKDVSLADLASGQVYNLGFAIHDSNTGGFTHQVSIPTKLGNEGTGADIVAVKVNDINAVNWTNIATLQTTVFKPGIATINYLSNSDLHPGAGQLSNLTCQSCHSPEKIAELANPLLP